jgi:hypothetical protein
MKITTPAARRAPEAEEAENPEQSKHSNKVFVAF